MNQFLIFIIGLPCSGKTSIAKQLAQRFNLLHLSTEQIRANILNVEKVEEDCDFTIEQQISVYETIFNQVKENLSKGKSIIVEGVFRSLEQRKAVIDTSLMYLDKDKIYCYNIICDESVAVKRLIERKNKGTVAPAGVNTYFKIKNQYEKVDTVIFKTIDNTENLENSYLEIVKDIERN